MCITLAESHAENTITCVDSRNAGEGFSIRSRIIKALSFTSFRGLSVSLYNYVVENEHYSTVSRLLSLECFIETTPDFLCPFMNY